MKQSDWKSVIDAAIGPALEYLDSLPDRPVYQPVTDPSEIRAALGGPMPDQSSNPVDVVANLARDMEPYLTAFSSGRFFGFVIGGLHPASYGADILTSSWDQNTGLYPIRGPSTQRSGESRWSHDDPEVAAVSRPGHRNRHPRRV